MVVLSFDIPNQLVEVKIPDTVVNLQEVWNKCSDFMDTQAMMSFSNFLFGSGKQELTPGKFTGITVTFVDWRLQFEARAGPALTVCIVEGGNFIGRVGTPTGAAQHPIAPTANTHATISQSTEAALLGGATPDQAHAAASYNGSSLGINIWLERSRKSVLIPTSSQIDWYNPDGTLLFTASSSSPDSRGNFLLTVGQTLTVNTAYYADVSVTDTSGTVTTRRSFVI